MKGKKSVIAYYLLQKEKNIVFRRQWSDMLKVQKEKKTEIYIQENIFQKLSRNNDLSI